MRSFWARLAVALAVASGACGGSSGNPGDPRQTVVELPATPNRDLDLLFVIDDSPGVLEAQINLTLAFPTLLARLQAVPGGLPSLHIGVVTSDMGTLTSGSPLPAPAIGQLGQGGCAGAGKAGALQTNLAQIPDRFLRDEETAGGTRTRNYAGSLVDAFGALVRAGGGGCGFEQPLAAMHAALDNNPSNAGFLRPQAMLGVVFATDEDDCSAASPRLFDANAAALGALGSFRCTRFGVTCTDGGQTPDAMNEVGAKSGCGPNPSSEIIDDVAPYRDFLLGLKSDPRRVMAGGILAPTQPVAVELRTPPGGGAPVPGLVPSCTDPEPNSIRAADPPVRLQSFLEGLPDRSASSTICQVDLSGGLARIGDRFRASMGSACVEAELADFDPAAPGAPTSCIVEDLVGATATPIDSCEEHPAAPCWQLEPDAATCPFSPPPHARLLIQRDAPPDPITITRMRCLVEP